MIITLFCALGILAAFATGVIFGQQISRQRTRFWFRQSMQMMHYAGELERQLERKNNVEPRDDADWWRYCDE